VAAINKPATALVLGAGFSAAVDSDLPTANELGNRARQFVADGGVRTELWREFSLDYPFELALSLLAERQPHLSELQNRRNAVQLTELTAAIATVLEQAQVTAFERQPPSWLYELLSVLNQWHSTIISLNQDLVIETAVESHYLTPTSPRLIMPDATRLEMFASGSLEKIDATDLLWHVPPLAGGNQHQPRNLAKSMRLLKLHGSVDWWWAPPDQTGATILREGVYGTFGNPSRMSDEVRRDYLPGRERFIVPPLATKSTYFNNPLTRQIWQDAFVSLQNAERIALVGYSLPITDHITFGLLQSVLERRNVHLDVVNSNVTELEPRLKALVGVTRDDQLPSWVQIYDGVDAIESYSHELADERSGELITGIKSFVAANDEDRTIHIRWPRRNGNVSHRVSKIEGPDDGGVVTLNTASVGSADSLDMQHGYDPNVERSDVKVADLIPRLVDAKSLVAKHGDSDAMRLVNYDANNAWIMFIPAGLVP
jgi:hypothetical protein